MVDNKQQSCNIHKFSFNDRHANTHKVHSKSLSTRARANLVSSPICTPMIPTTKITKIEPQKPISKIPVRSKSFSLGLAAKNRFE
jgi:hypothetical protein